MSEETTYTGDTAKIAHPVTHEWLHPLSDVVNAVIDAGLAIERLNEHERLAWQFAPWMVPVEGRRRMWVMPEDMPKMPRRLFAAGKKALISPRRRGCAPR